MKRLASLLAIALATLGLSNAQTPRPAVSANLTPEEAADIFEQTFINICIPTVGGQTRINDLPEISRKGLTASSDPMLRLQISAADDEVIWTTVEARGVVLLKERPNRCTVMVHGPHVGATLGLLTAKLASPVNGFERLIGKGGLSQSLQKDVNGHRLQIILTGSEPGSPGHQSRFPVVTATIFDMQHG